ncbi:MAG: enolase C-terminal domain-like protein [Alsobacter sp.]
MGDQPLTITGVNARAVIAPLQRPVRTAVGTIPAAPLVLIDVLTKEGVEGRAYVFAYTPAVLGALQRVVTDISGDLVDQVIAPQAIMKSFERRFRLLGTQGLVGMAVSGLDMALWDALGQAAGEPLVRLLGGLPSPLPAYDSYGVVDPKADGNVLADSVAAGFKAIKIKIGDADLVRDVQTVAAVREIIGPNTRLMVDFNQSLTVPDAVHRIRRLSEFDIHWFEEPVPAEDLAGHSRIRTLTGAPIQTGENWWFTAGMAAAIDKQASDYAMPDIMKIGGVTGWLSAMALAQAASLPVSSHIFPEASAHVMAVTPTAHYVEWLDLAGSVLSDPARVDRGMVTAKGPGLGINWDESAVRKFAV